MPVAIPLIAAYATASAGVAMATAVGASMAAMVCGGLMVAGGALTAIGAVSGNKQCSKWGGILSLAGGVGALATGAANATASTVADQAAGTATTTSTAAGNLSGSAAGTAATDGAAQLAGTEALTPVVDGSAASLAPATGLETAAAPVADTSGGLIGSNMATTAPVMDGGAEALAGSTMAPVGDVAAATPGVDAVAGAEALPTPPAGSVSVGAPTTEVAPSSVFDQIKSAGTKLSKFATDNKGLVQVGAGIVQGAMKNKSDQELLDQRYALAEEADARQRARLSASVQGLKMPVYQKAKA